MDSRCGQDGFAEQEMLAARLPRLAEEMAHVFVSEARIDEVCSHFHGFLGEAGCSSVTCYRVPASGEAFEHCLLLNTRPPDWTRHYLENDYVRRDAVVWEGLSTSLPYTWSEVYARRNTTLEQRRIHQERHSAGLREALVVPVYEGRGLSGVVSISCEDDPPADLRGVLAFASVYLHQRLVSERAFAATADATLTPREVECLRWAADGKSDWEIGQILNISAKTVNYHVENVKKKFGVATRVQAIVVALRQGRLG